MGVSEFSVVILRVNRMVLGWEFNKLFSFKLKCFCCYVGLGLCYCGVVRVVGM